jgi:hypothetical protein
MRNCIIGGSERKHPSFDFWEKCLGLRVDEMEGEHLRHTRLYCDCGAELVDGNFVLCDGKLSCTECNKQRQSQKKASETLRDQEAQGRGIFGSSTKPL